MKWDEALGSKATTKLGISIGPNNISIGTYQHLKILKIPFFILYSGNTSLYSENHDSIVRRFLEY